MENFIPAVTDLFSNTLGAMSLVGGGLLVYVCIIFVLLLFFLYRIYIAYYMAKKRHRDPIAWALLSFFVSPLMTWIILLIIGDAHN